MNLYQKINNGVRKFDFLTKESGDMLYPTKLTAHKYIYLGGDNASDELDKGRGDTPDKPFAKLSTVLNYIHRYAGRYDVHVVLQSDISEPDYHILLNNNLCNKIYLESASNNRYTIDCAMLYIDNAYVAISNLDFIFNSNEGLLLRHSNCYAYGISITNKSDTNARCVWTINGFIEISGNSSFNIVDNTGTSFLMSDHGGTITLHSANIEFTGSVKSGALYSSKGGMITMYNSTITGTVTGRKYCSAQGGLICFSGGVTPTNLPGTEEGTCDSTSTVG